jgi:hypothetical protein
MSVRTAENYLNVVDAFGEQKRLDCERLSQSFTAESLYYLSREVTPEDAIEDYCREKWGLTENYANKMIRGAQQYAAIKTGTKVPVLPERESHVRELCRLESDAEAASRRCEIRIGELLGKAERGRPAKEMLPASNISNGQRQDHHKFRLLAQHKALVSKLIDGGQVSTLTTPKIR